MTRTEIIQLLIDKYELKSYLEIGVFKGENFDKIRCDVKHSVDPEFPATFKMTSDTFFDRHIVMGYDAIFVDGDHTAEQAYIDIVNAVNTVNEGGFVVVHDCSPETEWHTRPIEEYNRGQEWNGGTYLSLLKYRTETPGLTIFTVDSDYGVSVITKRRLISSPKIHFTGGWTEFNNDRTRLLNLISTDKFIDIIK